MISDKVALRFSVFALLPEFPLAQSSFFRFSRDSQLWTLTLTHVFVWFVLVFLCYYSSAIWHLSFDIWHFPSRLHPLNLSLSPLSFDIWHLIFFLLPPALTFFLLTAAPHDRSPAALFFDCSTATLYRFALRAVCSEISNHKLDGFCPNINCLPRQVLKSSLR